MSLFVALKRLKNNKAAGIDEVAAELLKYGGRDVEEELTRILKDVWRQETMPREWEEGIIVPLHKKGDRAVCSNYRGLCLLTMGYKMMASILCARLLPH